jgi:hypothetical protein
VASSLPPELTPLVGARSVYQRKHALSNVPHGPKFGVDFTEDMVTISDEQKCARDSFMMEPVSFATPMYAYYRCGKPLVLLRVIAKVEWHPGELYPRLGRKRRRLLQ